VIHSANSKTAPHGLKPLRINRETCRKRIILPTFGDIWFGGTH